MELDSRYYDEEDEGDGDSQGDLPIRMHEDSPVTPTDCETIERYLP